MFSILKVSRQTIGLHKHPIVRSTSKRLMSQDHLQRTAENTRKEVFSLATVVGLRDESKTVKSLTLKVQDNNLDFKAGQWVDMFIPGVETVGGFSMCSSPCVLRSHQTLDLAVKYSTHPPAHWVHSQCKTGSEVHVRVGGDFFYDPVTNCDHDLLLIAGGVGINPLYSIVNHIADLSGKESNSTSDSGAGRSRVMLLYSSQTEDELIFKRKLTEIETMHSNIRCHFHVTRDAASTSNSENSGITYERINSQDVRNCFDWLRKERTLTYICGPFPMIKDMENILIADGLEQSSIKYEKWW